MRKIRPKARLRANVVKKRNGGAVLSPLAQLCAKTKTDTLLLIRKEGKALRCAHSGGKKLLQKPLSLWKSALRLSGKRQTTLLRKSKLLNSHSLGRFARSQGIQELLLLAQGAKGNQAPIALLLAGSKKPNSFRPSKTQKLRNWANHHVLHRNGAKRRPQPTKSKPPLANPLLKPLTTNKAPILGLPAHTQALALPAKGPSEPLFIKQSQSMDMLSRVARKVAHDFNNYLSVILGYSSLLQLKLNTNPNYHEELEGIQRAGNQATDFTNKLLSIGRSYQKVRMETLLWANLIEDCVPLLERTLAPRCTLQVQTTSEDLRMHADSTQLRLLLSELTKNAKEAMPNGGVLQIRAQAVRRTQIENFPEELPGEHWIQIELADQGSGMAPEIKERIFEPFFTTKLEQKSDGLGCTLAYAIAHAHGGWIDVKSQPGQGSQFSIFLPQLA